MTDMLDVSRAHYKSDPIELKKIDDFARDYQSAKATLWYTNDSFVYRLLNRAFRTQDIRVIFTFRFFILDLYTQLGEEAKKTGTSQIKKAFRGQFLPINELETIKNNIGGLISTNTFLSTTTDAQVAFIYSGNGSRLPSHASVVLEINLEMNDKNRSFERPFAAITKHSSKPDEKEILFSMGTIFKIVSVEDFGLIWFANLKIEHEVKECIAKLSTHLRSENMDRITSERTLGDFLRDMGELEKAMEFYQIILEQQRTIDETDSDIGRLYNSIGLLHIDQGDYNGARILFQQAYTIAKSNLSLMPTTLSNLGLVDLNQGRYNRALKNFERARKYEGLPSKMSSKILENISAVYTTKGQYKKARNYLRRALAIDEKYFPPFHFDLACSYSNLASVEMALGNYAVSLDLFEKCLNIYRQSLPSEHHQITNGLNNIGILYSKMGELVRAREYLEQALNIQIVSFEKKKDQHLLIASTLNNLGTLYYEQDNLSAAETTLKRALDIKLGIDGLDVNSHSSFANAYSNLASVQLKQGRFDEALANYERTLRIELQI
ncbi:unnamed protein product, partial [Rotaria sordida]